MEYVRIESNNGAGGQRPIKHMLINLGSPLHHQPHHTQYYDESGRTPPLLEGIKKLVRSWGLLPKVSSSHQQ